MRKLINQFKEPIYKDDLKRVLIYGSISAVLFGVLAGALQYFAVISLGTMFSIAIYLIAYMVGKELRDRVFTYHILYSVLGVLFFFVGCLFYNASFTAFISGDILLGIVSGLSFDGLISFVFSFLNFKTYVGTGIVNNILDILIMFFCVMTVWRMSTYRK